MEAGFWRQKHFRKRMAKAADGKGQRQATGSFWALRLGAARLRMKSVPPEVGYTSASRFSAIQEGLCSSVVHAASSSDNASATAFVCFASRTSRCVFARMGSTIAKTAVMPVTFVRKSDGRATRTRVFAAAARRETPRWSPPYSLRKGERTALPRLALKV